MRPPADALAGRPRLSLTDLPRRAALTALRLERELPGMLARAGAWHAEDGGTRPRAGNGPGTASPARRARLLLAVSGGADSTALACLLALLRPRLGLELHALTCDHGLRQEAAGEAAFAAELCAWLAIPCASAVLDVRREARHTGMGLEEAARALRYAALERERARTGCDLVLTAHHAGDLAEDMLMRLARGTGWPALGGMTAHDPSRRLLRPLLDTDPRLLRQFLKEARVPWCEDESNADARFTRNRVRHRLLPALEAENPQARRALLRLARQARLDAAYFEAELERALTAVPWVELDKDGRALAGAPSAASATGAMTETAAIRLPGRLLRGLAPALRARLILRAVRAIAAGGGQARGEALEGLLDALEHGGRPRTFQMSGGIEAVYARGTVTVRRARG